MLKILRTLEQRNPSAMNGLHALNYRLEDAGMFERTVDLDATPTSLILSRRHGPWRFQWSVILGDPMHDKLDTTNLFLGKPGSIISLIRPFPNRSRGYSVDSEINTTSADAEFRALVDVVKESLNDLDHSGWLSAAERMARFFLKQPT
ncbi:MAG: hypothetical protein WC551_04170 [Patescibacteria group bacterium]